MSLSGTEQILVQLGDSGGFETTGYVSESAVIQASPAVASETIGFNIRSNVAADAAHGTMTLVLSDSANFTWISTHSVRRSTSLLAIGGGSKSLSAELTQVRITTTGGDTLDAGSINILYED